jgi:hypothetical protein
MKTLFVSLLLFLAACAPISQTAANVSNFVVGTQVVSYETDTATLAASVQSITSSVPLYSGYTPLRVSEVATEKIVVSAKALQGSFGGNPDAEDFMVEFLLADKGSYTELTVRSSSASNETARQVVTDYVTALDKTFVRLE